MKRREGHGGRSARCAAGPADKNTRPGGSGQAALSAVMNDEPWVPPNFMYHCECGTYRHQSQPGVYRLAREAYAAVGPFETPLGGLRCNVHPGDKLCTTSRR